MNAVIGVSHTKKGQNRWRFLEALKQHRVVSRPQLAQLTQMSRTATSAVMDEFLERGLVREKGTGSSSGGRPPMLLEYNPDAAVAFGAVLNGQLWRVVATDLDANVLCRTEERSLGPSANDAVAALRRAVDALQPQVKGKFVLPAVGIGTPGLVDMRTGVIRTAVDIGWRMVPMAELVEQELGVQALVTNRSRAGVLAELWKGEGQGLSDLIYVYIGTGIAAGIVHQRKLYVGATSGAGELGHITVIPDGPLCRCGNRGCLQAVAAGPAMAQRAAEHLRRGRGGRLRAAIGDAPETLTAEMVCDAARLGDRLACEVVEETSEYIGIALAVLINLYDPELVVLGGPVGSDAALLDPVRKAVAARAVRFTSVADKVTRSSLGGDAGAIGAATLVLQRAVSFIFNAH